MKKLKRFLQTILWGRGPKCLCPFKKVSIFTKVFEDY